MKIRTTESGDKADHDTGIRRVWLSEDETEAILNVHDDYPDKDAALRLMRYCGLRSDEVTDVTLNDVEEIEGHDAYQLRIEDGKTGGRVVPLPTSLARTLKTYANSLRLGDHQPLIDVTTRTVQNWVTDAAEEVGGYDPDAGGRKDPEAWEVPDWMYVSAHDLRRTWATSTVYSGVPETSVLQWGGWKDYATFRDHYLNEESPSRRVEYMERAGLL